MEIEHETDSDQEVFIDEELTDWGHAAYMAGLSSDTEQATTGHSNAKRGTGAGNFIAIQCLDI